MLKCFFNEHPFISLLMVATVCETAVVMTKIIKEAIIKSFNEQLQTYLVQIKT